MDLRYTLAVAALLAGTACATQRPAVSAQSAEPLVAEPVEPVASSPTFHCDERSSDWPMFQRTPARDGATEAPPIASPAVAWSRPIGIASWLDNPLIADGRVFAPSSGQVWNRPDGGDGVYAFDLESGEQLWFAATVDDANGAAYQGCRVFVASDGGVVAALDARTGAELWSRQFEGKMYANPLPLGDVVVVAGADGVVAALSVRTGEVVWRENVGTTVRGGAASDGQRVFVTTEAAALVAFALNDGKALWMQQIESPGVQAAYATPTVRDGKVFVGFVRDTYYSTPAVKVYDAATGAAGWEPRNPQNLTGGWGNVRSSPAVHDGQLYWGESYSNRIVSLDAAEGEVTASVPAGSCMFPQWPSPAVAQDVVYLPRHDGGLYAYNVDESNVKWAFFVGDANQLSQAFPPEHLEQGERCQWDPAFGRPVYASPAVAADGTLIVATGDGWLHAIRDAE